MIMMVTRNSIEKVIKMKVNLKKTTFRTTMMTKNIRTLKF